ncbi:MAG: hypothetical protein J6W80_02580 [Kiritimatiellae bacterium]|nr:hypothetical protein [Kiritimatiellia bacterium]
MGRHVAEDFPSLDRTVDDACAAIGLEIEALAVPGLAGVVLGGGYGRGEGGVREGGRLSNDMDFFAITEEGAGEGGDVPRIAALLEPVSRKWTGKLGIDVDFIVRTPWRIRHDEKRIMIQELLRGYFDVAGKSGAELFAAVERRAAEDIPLGEAARLLMNRGMGLLLAREQGTGNGEQGTDSRDFVSRNINKCILGAGDALLVARHRYAWRAAGRADALDDALYRKAVEWKFRPKADPVCDWETARAVWTGAFGEVMEALARSGDLGRSIREALRWIVRRRTAGELKSFGQDCTVRVLRGVENAIRARSGIPQSLRRDWEIFN